MRLSLYDDFAESFSRKRKNPWKAFVDFIHSLEKDENFLHCTQKGVWCDLGAGNGRHLNLLTGYSQKYVGTDISYPLLCIAREERDAQKLHNWVACDLNALPFREKSFQSIVSVAVFHHVLSKLQMRRVLNKINRLINEEGIFILTVWGMFKGKNANHLKRKNFHRRMSHEQIVDSCHNSEKFILGVNDVLIPWTNTSKGMNAEKKPRIYHLYSYNELNIYNELFEQIKAESRNMGDSAGMNYFLFLKKMD